MNCSQCDAALPNEARFCVACGAQVAAEDAGAVGEYRGILERFLADGALQDWQLSELEMLRADLEVSLEAHQRLLSELIGAETAVGVELAIDAATIRDYRAGQQCLLRLRVRNRGARAVTVRVRIGSSASAEQHSASSRTLGPGHQDELRIMLTPQQAGHHAMEGEVEVVSLRGQSQLLGFEGFAFRVAARPGQQVFNIDASSQRVGVWENLGVHEQGGLMPEAKWHEVPLRPLDAPGRKALALASEEKVQAMETQKTEEALEHTHPPADRLPEGRVLVVVDPSGAGDARSLSEAVQQAGLRARIVLRAGVYEGPVELRGDIEIVGEPGVVVQAEHGAILRAVGERLELRNLVLQGTAPKMRDAPDGLEVRSGQVLLEDCEIATTDGNPMPGRGVAVRGIAQVQLERCTLRNNGVGIAVDTSSTGFFADEAGEPHPFFPCMAELSNCRLVNNRTGAAVGGVGRELVLTRCEIRNNNLGVYALERGRALVKDCALTGNARDLRSESDAVLDEQGNHH